MYYMCNVTLYTSYLSDDLKSLIYTCFIKSHIYTRKKGSSRT